MTNDQALGLIVLGLILLILFNWKKFVQLVVSLAVLFIRVMTVVGGIVMFFGIKSVGEGIGILILMVVVFWFADWLDNSFGLEDKASTYTPPAKGSSFPGSYDEPKKLCPYCSGSKRIGCDLSHVQRTPDNPFPNCWKCNNTGLMRCPYCP